MKPLFLFLLSSCLCFGQFTLRYSSGNGEHIGQGNSVTFTENEGTLTITRNFYDGITAVFDDSNSTDTWTLRLAGPNGSPLAEGKYLNAQKFGSQQTGVPGLEFRPNLRFCSTVAGQFKIGEVAYDIDGTVLALAVDFRLLCNENYPSIVGSLRFNSNVPIDLLEPVSPTFSLRIDSEPGEFIGQGLHTTFDNSTSYILPKRLLPNLGFQFRVEDATYYWDLYMVGPDRTPLSPGFYDDVARYPFEGPGQFGLSFTGNHRGSNVLCGTVEIFQIDVDPNNQNTLLYFQSDFTQYSECGTKRLDGSIIYEVDENSNCAESNDSWLQSAGPGVDINGNGLVDVLDLIYCRYIYF